MDQSAQAFVLLVFLELDKECNLSDLVWDFPMLCLSFRLVL